MYSWVAFAPSSISVKSRVAPKAIELYSLKGIVKSIFVPYENVLYEAVDKSEVLTSFL